MSKTYQGTTDRLGYLRKLQQKEIETLEASIYYHESQLMTERTKLHDVQKFIETIDTSIETLKLLDDAGITLKKPTTENRVKF